VAVTKTDEGEFRMFERTILKNICGLICVNAICRIKYNDELYSLYTEPSMVKVIKIGRLKRLGNVARMEDNVLCMKISCSQPEVSRKNVRPRLSWLDSVLKDLKALELNTWWKKHGIEICGVKS
jgi:hypothetical protein